MLNILRPVLQTDFFKDRPTTILGGPREKKLYPLSSPMCVFVGFQTLPREIYFRTSCVPGKHLSLYLL